MKNIEIHEISRQISNNLRLFIDPIRLIVPLLFTHAKNKKDFFILFELSKFQPIRNKILNIIKKDENVEEKLQEIIRKRSNKKILNKIDVLLYKIQNNEEICL